jgi:hypothetical protein
VYGKFQFFYRKERKGARNILRKKTETEKMENKSKTQKKEVRMGESCHVDINQRGHLVTGDCTAGIFQGNAFIRMTELKIISDNQKFVSTFSFSH